jgi:cytochrome bd-type quinol oxidase subunit 2
MSAFEALFAFYGLLLGLAIAAVATGFGDQWRRRRLRPVGLLVPLLGTYLLLAVTRQWQNFFAAREALTMTPATLFTCLAMALPYTFAAQVMFPAAEDDIADGDSHYLALRRILVGVLMVPPAISLLYNIFANSMFLKEDIGRDLNGQFVPLMILATLIPLKRRRWQIAGLTALVLNRLVVIAI